MGIDHKAKVRLPAPPLVPDTTLASIAIMDIDELRLALTEATHANAQLKKEKAALELEVKYETNLRAELKEELEDELAEAREEADDARNDRLTAEATLVDALTFLGVNHVEVEMLLQRVDVDVMRDRFATLSNSPH